ncbi:hypothetical protein G6F31_021132 [Rhizopus arrhizus]|nr:hypothetical protein G6F31_021132 [Rhizopus arrhizus]
MHPIDDPFLFRRGAVHCINEAELSPAALAARVALVDLMRAQAGEGPADKLHSWTPRHGAAAMDLLER